MSDLGTLLGRTTPEQLAGDPVLRKAFITSLMAADIFVPVEESAAAQADAGGVTLMAIAVEGLPHVLLFSSKENLENFANPGQRFAKAKGHALFPSLMGQNAVLNPGPSGLRLTPSDIAEINGQDSTERPQGSCGAPGHVHGPDCQH